MARDAIGFGFLCVAGSYDSYALNFRSFGSGAASRGRETETGREDVSRGAFSNELVSTTRCPASLFLLGPGAHESPLLYRCPYPNPSTRSGDPYSYLTATKWGQKPPFPSSFFASRSSLPLSYRLLAHTRIPPKIVSAVLDFVLLFFQARCTDTLFWDK